MMITKLKPTVLLLTQLTTVTKTKTTTTTTTTKTKTMRKKRTLRGRNPACVFQSKMTLHLAMIVVFTLWAPYPVTVLGDEAEEAAGRMGEGRFCNTPSREEVLTDCAWPCSNVASCPAGSEFESHRDCQVPAWQKDLYKRNLNVTISNNNNNNSNNDSSDDYNDYNDYNNNDNDNNNNEDNNNGFGNDYYAGGDVLNDGVGGEGSDGGVGNATNITSVSSYPDVEVEKVEDVVEQLQNATACQAVCSRPISVPQCCPGFFGSECLACPKSVWSGYEVCSGRGICNDLMDGNGTCHCQDGFTGVACEQCQDADRYGTNCTEECQCVNGFCDNGPTGTGKCRLCFEGFQGLLCDEEIITCDNLTCANHSRCEELSGQAQCVCDPGYEGQPSNVTACTPVDVCAKPDRPVCGERVCVYMGPGRFQCRCPDGHRDDGVTCHPINPCNFRNGGCDLQTSVCMHTGANMSTCDCLAYYENYVDGVGCSLVDVCPSARCHANANCTTTGPNQYRCTCLPGYVGDGQENCFGNIMERLDELNRNHPTLRNQLTMAIGLLDRLLNKALKERGPFTIFVPNNRAFRKARRDFPLSRMMRMPRRSLEIVHEHMLAGALTLEDLQGHNSFYTLQGSVAELQVRVMRNVFKYRVRGHPNKAKVIARDLIASNGMVHVVNELLITEPAIVGDASMTALALIREEGRFNRMQTLISSLGLESMFERDDITVFASENGGLDGLPEGTLDYLMTDEEGKAKLRTLLENHIFPGRISVTELVSLKRIRSIANYSFDVSIGDKGRIQLNRKVNVSQADIPCRNAVYYHVDGPLIPEELADILPSRCDIVRNKSIQGRCVPCNSEMKCPMETDVFQGEVLKGCKFWGELEGRYAQIEGCKPICGRTYRIPRCCPGFYGKECLPCPGGHKNPCGGRGECSDQMFGTGFCICDVNFRGDKCEKCLRLDKFGPNCTEDCTCRHGRCRGGPEGDGRCETNSCYAGFQGENCDQESKLCGRVRLTCHLHALCAKTQSAFRCECQTGYEGDGKVCTEIDPCQKPDRGNCHRQAKCTKVGPGAHHCECEAGWIGDGFSCLPIIACNSSDHCHPDASCVDHSPGLYTCKCKEGYEGNGTVCTEVDACLHNNGGCHELANCTSTGPGTTNCSCPENFVGDGTRCFTTISGHIQTHPNLTLLTQLIQKQDDGDDFLGEVGESFTFFAPSDDAMRHFLNERVPSGYFDDVENVMTFFQFHTVAQDYTLQEMMALESIGNYGRMETLFDGYSVRVFIKNKTVNVLSSQTTSASVVSGDIAGLNGHLHVIDGVLEPFLPDAEQPFLREFFELNTRYSMFGEWLEKKGLMEKLQAMDHYSLFVPDNSVFLPSAINHTITTEYLQSYIAPSIVLTPALDSNQSVNTLLGERHRLHFTTNGSQVKVNGVNIVRSNLLMMEGVVHVISGLLHPVLHFCNKTLYKKAFAKCGSCYPGHTNCPVGFEKADSGIVEKCYLRLSSGRGYLLGCKSLCQQTSVIPQCCSGYYGPNCDECPGGPEEPCGGRGVCDDGMEGQGVCLCDRLFTGPQCLQCLDADMAGPACNIDKQSCGYRNGNCSQNAECSDTRDEDGVHVHCRCRPGYVGDGFICTSPCDTHNGGCHDNATCSVQSQNQTVRCTCKEGFHGTGVTCTANRDLCEEENGRHGQCSPFADCRYTPPPVTSEEEGTASCECDDGFVGNGTLCVTTLLNAIRQLPGANDFNTKLLHSMGSDNVSQQLDSDQSSLTVFVPLTLTDLLDVNVNDYVVKDIVLLTPDLAEVNSSHGAIFAASGLPLPVSFKDGQYYVRGCRVVEKNIPAVNGYMHFLASSFHSEEGSVGTSTDPSSGSLELTVILVPVAFLVVVVVVVVGIVVCYRRSQATGFLDFVKNIRRGSDASMSFARLKVQESEDDTHSPFGQPDNVNFHNPLYNDPETL